MRLNKRPDPRNEKKRAAKNGALFSFPDFGWFEPSGATHSYIDLRAAGFSKSGDDKLYLRQLIK